MYTQIDKRSNRIRALTDLTHILYRISNISLKNMLKPFHHGVQHLWSTRAMGPRYRSLKDLPAFGELPDRLVQPEQNVDDRVYGVFVCIHGTWCRWHTAITRTTPLLDEKGVPFGYRQRMWPSPTSTSHGKHIGRCLLNARSLTRD